MLTLKRFVFFLTLCSPLIFTSCETSRVASGGPYHVTAYKPNDPSKVVVNVSLAAQKVYALVHNGTPVHIATTQPEDASIGPKVKRVDDSRAPDPDPGISITSAAFQKPSGPLLE